LTAAALAGAILVGFSGGKWIQAESDKQLNRATAQIAAQTARQLSERSGAAPLDAADRSEPSRQLDTLITTLETGTALNAFEAARSLQAGK
jgi:hypothetical protein